MDKKEILRHIDHTLLKPYAVWEDIRILCEEAVEYKTASVCIPPCYVERVHDKFDTLNICTVVGFPLGYSVTAAKLAEVEKALKVEAEIRALKEACGGHVLKVIIETCYLTGEEKIAMCQAVTKAGADYIKTSTGFGTGGATLEDVRLFREHIGPSVKIKAAGGVKSREDLEMFLEAGCDRIGTSSAVGLLKGEEAGDY